MIMEMHTKISEPPGTDLYEKLKEDITQALNGDLDYERYQPLLQQLEHFNHTYPRLTLIIEGIMENDYKCDDIPTHTGEE